MKSYETPDDPEGMEPAEAQAALNLLTGEALSDRGHPLADGGHALHRQYVAHQHRLAEILEGARGAEQAEADERARAAFGATPDEAGEKTRKALRDFLSGPGAHRDAVRAEAETEMAHLVDLGFEEASIPDDVEPWQVLGLRMQRLNVQGDVENLAPLMEHELRSLKAPAETLAALQSYIRAADQDPDLRQGIFEQLISWIYQANTQRYGQPTPRTPDMEEDDDDDDL